MLAVNDLSIYNARQKKAFALARRHSKLVVVLRALIPALCVIGLIAGILYTFLNPFGEKITQLSVSTVGISGSKITMQMPKLSGYKKDLRSYNVMAQTAVQDVKHANMIELTLPDAIIELEKQRYAHVLAATGLYDTSSESMELKGGVRVKTDTGYDITMQDAHANIKAGSIATDKPVKVIMQNGTIDADSMDVQDSGKIIFFRGNVVTFFKSVDTNKSNPETEPAEKTPE